MNGHPAMPIPAGQLTPRELLEEIKRWAVAQGYTYEDAKAHSEFARIVVRDPKDGSTYTTIPNAHQGRRLRPDQVRYTIRNLNNNWRA
jgi:hypothetical protein